MDLKNLIPCFGNSIKTKETYKMEEETGNGVLVSKTASRLCANLHTVDIQVTQVISYIFLLYCKLQVGVKKFVPNKKGDKEWRYTYYLCQPNTYVIAREFGEQQ